MYQVLEYDSFFLQEGDTMLVTYDQRMAGQDVQLLFISMDSSEMPWMKKVQQNADILAGSCRVLDQDAVFLKEIRLNRFPRYLIYDRNGKLVDPDAPRPSNSRVDMALKRWL